MNLLWGFLLGNLAGGLGLMVLGVCMASPAVVLLGMGIFGLAAANILLRRRGRARS